MAYQQRRNACIPDTGVSSPEVPLVRSASGTMAGRALELVLAGCVVLFLAVTSFATLVCTSTYPDYSGAYSLSFTTAPIAIISMVLIVGFIWILCKMGLLDRIDERRFALLLAGYTLLAGVAWAVLADVWPDWDSGALFDAGRTFGEQGVHYYEPGRYVERFPYQMTYVMVIHVMSLITSHYYAAMEVLNALFTAWLAYLIAAIAREVFQNRRITNICIVLQFLYLPPIFYTTFAYPNMISLAFAAFAMLCQVKLIRAYEGHRSGDQKLCPKRATYAAGFCLGCAFSYLFKSSMLLALVSMGVVWVVYAVRWLKVTPLIVVLAMAGACALSVMAVNGYVEYRTGISTSRSMPSSAYISMGLDLETTGWYNGFLWSLDNGDETTYDPDAYDAAALAEIRGSIETLLADPAFAAAFFAEKYCSEWCDPTSESLLASNWSHASPGVDVMSERPLIPLVRAVYYGPLHEAIVVLLDGMQTLIMGGSLVAVVAGIRARRRTNAQGWQLQIGDMAPLLYAAGLGLFYLVWEAKAQYTLPAYIVLIPFAAAAVSYLIQAVDHLRRPRSESIEEVE